MIRDEIIRKITVKAGKKVDLKDHETGWAQDDVLKKAGEEQVKDAAMKILDANRQSLAESQELLWASGAYSVLIVLQGMDTAGKDGTIRHVMSGVNPQGCRVQGFKVPTQEELSHNFLWRYSKALPSRGEIGIFNRSYYEDVLVVKVHPEILDAQRLPPGKRDQKFWDRRYRDINAFENHLVQNGTIILKFFLHISKEEQKRRLLERLENKEKYWKVSPADLKERGYWDDYIQAYEAMLSNTSTRRAPWYIIPADFKWAARALVADVVSRKIQELDLRYPEVTKQQVMELKKSKKQLKLEGRS
jgi:PPK2 family polyphosphate:nucleotide phosphotransferase